MVPCERPMDHSQRTIHAPSVCSPTKHFERCRQLIIQISHRRPPTRQNSQLLGQTTNQAKVTTIKNANSIAESLYLKLTLQDQNPETRKLWRTKLPRPFE